MKKKTYDREKIIPLLYKCFYYNIENPVSAAAVARAWCGAYNDQNFIEFVKRIGSSKEILEQLEQYKRKCTFLQAVLDNMPDKQQES